MHCLNKNYKRDEIYNEISIISRQMLKKIIVNLNIFEFTTTYMQPDVYIVAIVAHLYKFTWEKLENGKIAVYVNIDSCSL